MYQYAVKYSCVSDEDGAEHQILHEASDLRVPES